MAADEDMSLNRTNGDGQLSEQTARLQAEIDEQAGLIRLITENISEAFWIADAGLTRTLYASPGYEIVMGLTLESLYDDPRSFLNAIHPEDKGRLIADMEVLKLGLPFNHDYRVVHPDGSVRWVWSRGFPDKKSGLSIYVGIVEDITERMELQKIMEQEHSFRKAIEGSIAAGIAAVDLEGRQIYANPSFCKMVGWEQDELVGALPPYIYWAPEDLCNIDSALKATLDGNAPQEGFDAIFRKKTGERFNVNILISPLVDAAGVKTGWLASVYDITARKLMENELKTKTHMLSELNGNLESLVMAKVDELSRKEQLLIQQSKMAAMGEMIGAIAHQWRQPLNSLSLMIQDLKDAHDFGAVNDGYINTAVKAAMSQINFMSTTIDVFRNFFNPSKKEEALDIIGVCSDVFSMLSSQLKVNSIAYRISCNKHNRTYLNDSEVMPCDEAVITANKNHLAHVLLNLINNAKDAILLRREKGLLTADGMIAVDCNKENQTLKVEISDNGGGIPEAIIDKIFEPYFTTKTGKGTGIGLYMSRVIVEESLGGRIYARNTDVGSVFTIELYV